MRRNVMALAMVVMLLSPLAVFAGGQAETGGDADAAETTQETVTLDVWSWRAEDAEEYEMIFDRFQEENPGIEINFRTVRNTEYNTVLATALEGGQGPDVMQLRAYGGLQRYTDFLLPLGDKIPALEGFSESSLASATGRDDGVVYGVPFANQALGIYYNERIFEENGLSEPSTWDEFMNVVETLDAAGVTPLANGGQAAWMLEIMFGTIGPNFYGGNEFFQEVVAGDTDFTDDRFVTALEHMQELAPYMPNGFMGLDYASMQANFFTEQAAMYIGGSFEAAFFQEQNPNLRIGVFPAPAADDGGIRLVGTWADGSYGVNADTDKQDAAVALVEFMAGETFGTMFTNSLAQISPVPGVQADPNEVPVLSQFITMMDEFGTTPYIMLVGFRWEQPTGSVALQNALQGMMQGDMSPEEVAEQVNSEIASWYEPFQD